MPSMSDAAARTPVGPKKVPLSVAIPTLNEAANLPRCLDHLAWADEVVVIDSGSTDETCQIARAYGAKVIDFRWNGQWPKKRNWVLRHGPLKHEWILMVDADEWIVPELAEEIGRAIEDPDFVGYWINRRFIFMGRWIRHCGYYPSWNLRLIKRGYGEFEKLTDIADTGSGDNEVHEHLVPRGPVGHLKHDMLHFAFPNIATFVEKHNRYSNWEAAVQFRHGIGHPSAPQDKEMARRRKLKTLSRHLPFRPLQRFLYHYVFRGGFLDGRPGLILCRLMAFYEFLSVAKYHEMKQNQESSRRIFSAVPAHDWRQLAENPSPQRT